MYIKFKDYFMMLSTMSKVQSVLFDKTKWTSPRARRWLKKNDLNPIKRADITENKLRYRIRDPRKFKEFRTISVGRSTGIQFVLGVDKKDNPDIST